MVHLARHKMKPKQSMGVDSQQTPIHFRAQQPEGDKLISYNSSNVGPALGEKRTDKQI